MREIYWTCLKEKCSKNCCSKEFAKRNFLYDTSLLIKEKNFICEQFGPEFLKEEKHGIYLKVRKDEDCLFFDREQGSCNIYKNRPAVCRAFPLTILDVRRGAVFDYENCPGFEYAEKNEIKISPVSFNEMILNFIEIQQNKLRRLKVIKKRIINVNSLTEYIGL